jgi:hypothetical protein
VKSKFWFQFDGLEIIKKMIHCFVETRIRVKLLVKQTIIDVDVVISQYSVLDCHISVPLMYQKSKYISIHIPNLNNQDGIILLLFKYIYIFKYCLIEVQTLTIIMVSHVAHKSIERQSYFFYLNDFRGNKSITH